MDQLSPLDSHLRGLTEALQPFRASAGLLARWGALMDGSAGLAHADPPGTSATEKWRYWRVRLADGSRVSVNITAKDTAGDTTGDPGRCTVSVAHAGLASPADVEHWRAFWRDRLREL